MAKNAPIGDGRRKGMVIRNFIKEYINLREIGIWSGWMRLKTVMLII